MVQEQPLAKATAAEINARLRDAIAAIRTQTYASTTRYLLATDPLASFNQRPNQSSPIEAQYGTNRRRGERICL
eukprot:7893232-Pyramimonas_sp.AAC.1